MIATRSCQTNRRAGGVWRRTGNHTPPNVLDQRRAHLEVLRSSWYATWQRSAAMRRRSVAKRQANTTPMVKRREAWKKSTRPAACRKRFRAISVAGRPTKYATPASTANTRTMVQGRTNISTTGLTSWRTAFRSRSVSKLVMDRIIPEGFLNLTRRRRKGLRPLRGVLSTLSNVKVMVPGPVHLSAIYDPLDQGVILDTRSDVLYGTGKSMSGVMK